MEQSNKWVTVTELAKRLGYSRQGLYVYIRSGVIRCEHVGVVPLIPMSEVERLEDRLRRYGKKRMFQKWVKPLGSVDN